MSCIRLTSRAVTSVLMISPLDRAQARSKFDGKPAASFNCSAFLAAATSRLLYLISFSLTVVILIDSLGLQTYNPSELHMNLAVRLPSMIHSSAS